MDRGRTDVNGPHQGAWVELRSGESWFVHFQDRGAYGRVVHLQPMKWIEDWPVIGVDADGDGKGEPVAQYRKPNVGREFPIRLPQTSDEFRSNKLGLQWQWHANPRKEWHSVSRGSLRLNSIPVTQNLWTTPNLLLQKLPARKFTVTTLVDASHLLEGERSGLLIMGRDYSYLAVSGLYLIRVTCLDAEKGTADKVEIISELKNRSVFLRVSVNDGVCEFSYSVDGKTFHQAGDTFVATQGVWIGAKVGLFSIARPGATTRGYAD
jgi:beta-xylosidase